MGPAGLNLTVTPSSSEVTSSGNTGARYVQSTVFSASETGGFPPVTYSWHSLSAGAEFLNPTNASSQIIRALVGLWEIYTGGATCTITDSKGNQSSENVSVVLRNYGVGPQP
jgi:hypothetical protein